MFPFLADKHESLKETLESAEPGLRMVLDQFLKRRWPTRTNLALVNLRGFGYIYPDNKWRNLST